MHNDENAIIKLYKNDRMVFFENSKSILKLQSPLITTRQGEKKYKKNIIRKKLLNKFD